MKMHQVLELLVGIPVVLYYMIESFIIWLIPKRLRYKDITGETVVITGAGSGIGRELAFEFAKRGTRLVLLDINVEGLHETQKLVEKKLPITVDVFRYKCDVANRKDVYSVASKIKQEVGTVTILVNNAGIVTGKRFLDCPDDMIQKTMDVNVMAHFWTCKAFLPDMQAANHGHIVTVASIAGFLPAVHLVDYCTSKYAAVGFDECLRLELEHEGYTGIKTTLIAPSFVTTGLFQGFKLSWVSELTAEKVAKDIVSGMLVDQEVVTVPGWFSPLIPLKASAPRIALRQLYKITGLTGCMENFQGRKKIE